MKDRRVCVCLSVSLYEESGTMTTRILADVHTRTHTHQEFDTVFPGFMAAWEAYLPRDVQNTRCVVCERVLLRTRRGVGVGVDTDAHKLQVPYSVLVDARLVPRSRYHPFVMDPGVFSKM